MTACLQGLILYILGVSLVCHENRSDHNHQRWKDNSKQSVEFQWRLRLLNLELNSCIWQHEPASLLIILQRMVTYLTDKNTYNYSKLVQRPHCPSKGCRWYFPDIQWNKSWWEPCAQENMHTSHVANQANAELGLDFAGPSRKSLLVILALILRQEVRGGGSFRNFRGALWGRYLRPF